MWIHEVQRKGGFVTTEPLEKPSVQALHDPCSCSQLNAEESEAQRGEVTQPTRGRVIFKPRSDIKDGTLPSPDLEKKPQVGESVLALPWVPGLRG